MLRTSMFVSAVVLVAALFAVTGGAAAHETAPDAERVETTAATQQADTEAEIIVEDRAGNRLSDITVTAEWDNGESDPETTSSAGRALIDVPDNADVEFYVNDTDDQFVRNHQPVTVSPENIDEPVTIQMAPRGQTELSVTDANDDPVEDVTLRLFHEGDTRLAELVTTDENGVATVSDIEQRRYDVRITRPNFNHIEQIIEVNDTSVTESFQIERNRVIVDFTVRDDHFEEPQPLKDATVNIRATRATAGDRFDDAPLATDEDGKTQAPIPVNNNYQLTVLLEGYQETTETLRLSQQPTSVDLTTQRTPSISINQLQDAIVVGQPTQVTITNAYEEPVEGATVSLNDETVGQTDAQGQIVFNITEADSNTIEAEADGLTASVTLQGVDANAGGSDGTDSTDDGTDEQTDGADDGDDSSDDDSADSIGPGFGIVAALAALLGVGLLARRS